MASCMSKANEEKSAVGVKRALTSNWIDVGGTVVVL